MPDELPPFHLSIPVSDLVKAREFYLNGNVLDLKGQPRERIFATE